MCYVLLSVSMCFRARHVCVFEEMTWTCALPVFVCRCVMPEVSAKNQSVNSCVILLVYRWWSPKCLSCRYVPVLYLPVTVCMHVSLIWSVMLTSRSSAGAKDVKSAWQRMGSEEGKIMRTYICVVWLRRHENRNKEIKGGHETERETLLQLMMLKSMLWTGCLTLLLFTVDKAEQLLRGRRERDGTIVIFIVHRDKNTHNNLIVVNFNWSHNHNCELKCLLWVT